MIAVTELAAQIGMKSACRALALNRGFVYRHRANGPVLFRPASRVRCGSEVRAPRTGIHADDAPRRVTRWTIAEDDREPHLTARRVHGEPDAGQQIVPNLQERADKMVSRERGLDADEWNVGRGEKDSVARSRHENGS